MRYFCVFNCCCFFPFLDIFLKDSVIASKNYMVYLIQIRKHKATVEEDLMMNPFILALTLKQHM